MGSHFQNWPDSLSFSLSSRRRKEKLKLMSCYLIYLLLKLVYIAVPMTIRSLPTFLQGLESHTGQLQNHSIFNVCSCSTNRKSI